MDCIQIITLSQKERRNEQKESRNEQKGSRNEQKRSRKGSRKGRGKGRKGRGKGRKPYLVVRTKNSILEFGGLLVVYNKAGLTQAE